MKQELQDQLIEEYPSILRECHLSPRESCMGRGIECGDGWFTLLRYMLGRIQHFENLRMDKKKRRWDYFKSLIKRGFLKDRKELLKKYWWTQVVSELRKNVRSILLELIQPKSPFVATQIKEKFGVLTVYSVGGDEYSHGAVALAESLSAVTCELCGNPGCLTYESWVAARCEAHRNITKRDWSEL